MSDLTAAIGWLKHYVKESAHGERVPGDHKSFTLALRILKAAEEVDKKPCQEWMSKAIDCYGPFQGLNPRCQINDLLYFLPEPTKEPK